MSADSKGFLWFDFEPEPQMTGDGSGDPDKQFLTIATPDGEELTVIVHRTCHGGFPIDGPTANHKRALAEHIVAALNAYDQPLPQYCDLLQEKTHTTDTYFADFNGYDATGGERLLEGVNFRVELTETSDSFEVTSVAPVPDAMPYLAHIRWETFAEVIKGLAEHNLAHLATCAAQQHTTLKAMFDEFATENGENGGQLLAEV